MKMIIGICLLSLSMSAFSAIKPQNYKCSEMQEYLQENGVLKVRVGLLGFSRYNTYSDNYLETYRPCSFTDRLVKTLVRSKDLRTCHLGTHCKMFNE